jgi:hypothetical protein
MKTQFSRSAWLGAGLFAAGLLLGLSLSTFILWGEIEVRLDIPYPSSTRLEMKCPLMLSPAESGRVEAVIVNSTVEEVKPVVIVDVNRAVDAPVATQTILLSPRETQSLEWTIDGSNLIFDRLILVNIYQSPYRDNPSRLGSCSILSFNFPGLTGMQTFSLLFATSLASILAGGGLWLYDRWQWNDWSGITQAGIVLGVLMIAALISSVARWWGFTLLFDASIVLLAGVLLTEFILFPRNDMS